MTLAMTSPPLIIRCFCVDFFGKNVKYVHINLGVVPCDVKLSVAPTLNVE